MPKFLVKQTFKGAIRGIHVREFVMGERVEIDDPDLARVALEGGWIESWVEPVAPEPDPEKAAPKNKAAKAAPKVKDTATE
jgi:hypothetical protein